jgi:hypothetical protein
MELRQMMEISAEKEPPLYTINFWLMVDSLRLVYSAAEPMFAVLRYHLLSPIETLKKNTRYHTSAIADSFY